MASHQNKVPWMLLTAASAVVVALVLPGCSVTRTPPPASTEPSTEAAPPSEAAPVEDATPAEDAPVEDAPVEVVPEETEPAEPTPDDDASDETAPAETPPAETPPAEVAPPEPAPADTTSVEDPAPIRVKISDEERAKLIAQLEADLETATTRASSRPGDAELSAEQRQRWDTLDQYIELARASVVADDIRAAADLALKARLLADELAPR